MVGLINSLIVMTLVFYCLQKIQIVYVWKVRTCLRVFKLYTRS